MATSNIATGNATSLSWSTPAQLSGNSGISTFAFTCYTLANAQPATPTSNTGSWNFSTSTGVAPTDPNGNPSITFSTDLDIIQSVNSIGLYNYYTLYPETPSSPTITTLTISNTIPTQMDVFMVGPGGNGGSIVTRVAGSPPYEYFYTAIGGNGGQVVYQPNVAFSNNTYNLNWLNSPNTTNYNINLGGNILIQANANTGAAGGTISGFSCTPGADGVADPYNAVTWVGQLAANGLAFFGAGGGATQQSVDTSFNYLSSSNSAGGFGGGGNGIAFMSSSSSTNSTTNGLTASGGGGGGYIENGIAQGFPGFGGTGVMIFRQKIPVTWSTQQPTSTANAQVWSSTAYITTDNPYAGNVAAVTWSTPVQVNSSRGVFTSAYVVTPSDPTFYTAAQFTANFSAPRTNTNPPIGTGYSPITGDTASFTYRPTNTVVTKTFYANINQWLSANTQVISGNLFVSNSITATALITTDVYPLNITSQNATFGSFSSPGFWMAASNGNARFGGTMSIGNSLTVGNNAVIGNNLLIGNNTIIGSSLVVGANASIGNNLVVGNNALVGNNMVIGTNLVVGANASIGNNLVVGNNALVGNNTIIGSSLVVGANASIGNNLVVGNNALVGNNTIIGSSLVVGANASIGNNLVVGNNALVGNAMAIGNYLTVGTNASIGNNLFIGNNAIIGNSASIGANLIVGQSASIGANLIVGNNAVIGGNLTILGLVSGGNLSANVVNTTNIAYNAITATQMAPLSIASAALQSASLLSRMFAPNSVPPSALSPAASVQLITVIDSSGTSISDPTLDEFYDFGPTVTLTVNPGDEILISVTGTAILGFADTVPYVSEFTTTFKIIGTNPDSSVNGSGEQIAYWMNWAEFNAYVQTNYQSVEHTFTATQAGTMTFSLQFAYGYTDNLGADPSSLEQDGATTMVALLAPYTG